MRTLVTGKHQMEKQQRQIENGSITGTTWQCDDIVLGHAITQFDKLGSFSAGNKNDVVRLHFGLRGDYKFAYKQLNRSFDLIGGHHNIMYSNGFDMTVENKTLLLETFGVQMPKHLFLKFAEHASDQLKRFSDQVIKGESVILTENWGAIDASIQLALQQIINCQYAGDLKKLFLLSKSIELLVLSADACNTAENKKELYIRTTADKEKIIAARDLINERLASPPNLSEISRTVGLNEYKLKRGFREIFNASVFNYLTDNRLNLARQYLQDTQKTAAQVAYELGYTTPQHFNNAFKKKFGITPFSVRNNP